MTLVIGLTGGIASGKSTVSTMLKEMDIPVIDADVEARLAVQTGEPAYKQIVAEFGQEILQENGEIDRAKLGAIIFHDPEKRQRLNDITHPEIRTRILQQVDQAKKNQVETIVLDIPLLFEGNQTYPIDKTILVFTDYGIQLRRLMNRNHLSMEDAKARINSQMSLTEKRKRADAVIDNNRDVNETRNQLLEVLVNWGIQRK